VYCNEFANCHAAADSAFALAKQMVELKVNDLKETFVLHRRVECRIANWPLTTSSKNSCDGLTVDASHLEVTFPAKPEPVACTNSVSPMPGETQWKAVEYDSKSWKALVKPMQPCTTTTTTLGVGDIKIGDVPALAKKSTCDSNGGRWILFGSMTSTGENFKAQDRTNSPTNSGISKGDSVQIGTFTKGAPTDDVYSLDVQQLAASNTGSTFDLMIEYGNDDVYSRCISGFAMTGNKFLNNDRTEVGIVVGEHGLWGSENGPVDGYYATFCAYRGSCGGQGKDFWAFSTNGVYPSGASRVPCGFHFGGWKQCPAGDNVHRMRYYIRFQEA